MNAIAASGGGASSVVIRPVAPADLEAVLVLWRDAMGDHYPLTLDVLSMVLERNPSMRSGDALVAVDAGSGRTLGFGYLTLQRLPDEQLENFRDRAHLQAIVVDPAHRRLGIGRALAGRLAEVARREGRILVEAGSGFFYLWPGIPTDLEGAEAFARAVGLEPASVSFDLRGDVGGIEIGPADRHSLATAGLRVDRAAADDIDQLLEYLYREFGGEWWHDIRWLLAEGLDPAALVVLRTAAGEIVGHARIHRPTDRPIAPPLFWSGLRGPNAGGLGPIGVAASIRGRGLGHALLVAALAELRVAGLSDVVIDFTTLLDFYGPVGFQPWMTFRHAHGSIQNVLAATRTAATTGHR
ncbi:MAG TPA: GNAT family N-acetyltransferase [Candidatus Limnocylindrales bacterium]|nr:GNAT family N-acetyltransferase [Candidatus Limnocylindrales bacterium]